jgi:hypothetical protein
MYIGEAILVVNGNSRQLIKNGGLLPTVKNSNIIDCRWQLIRQWAATHG